jgi:D-arabinose 1-dehydrogenase-like Zn-dependent alcohol dehydrogenase
VHFVAGVRRGDVVLLHAAAGGVGHLALQLARRAGARVLGTVSTDEKASRAAMRRVIGSAPHPPTAGRRRPAQPAWLVTTAAQDRANARPR